MSGNENNNYLTTNETKYLTTRYEINKSEFLDHGPIITKAKWIEKNITVVLKAVSRVSEFIKEIKAFYNIGLMYSSITNEENKEKTSLIGYENVIKFFGVSSILKMWLSKRMVMVLKLLLQILDFQKLFPVIVNQIRV
ncbi:hypothetical protein C2G38_2144386 [Gigaspora rosea]|uniref:Uncharacterized protein n=1 Tax=Gigaspora rosea TaxID=44941 RepID=A0A397UU33_9GLOM|nr:hypothetical protein C2G38_2144386 [Gigaspora rosea]